MSDLTVEPGGQTIGQYLKSCREAKGLSIRTFAMLVYTRVARKRGEAIIAQVEDGTHPAHTSVGLYREHADLADAYLEFCDADPDRVEQLLNEADGEPQ